MDIGVREWRQVRVHPEVYAEIERVALEEGRSVPNMLNRILRQTGLAPRSDAARRDVAARVEERRPVAVDAGAVVYGCASCEFTASSPSARCPRHAGRLVERRP